MSGVRGLIVNFKEYGKSLVISDTHVGHEFELLSKGVKIPQQTQKIIDEILNICINESISSIFILGDIKHELPIAIETRREVYHFIETLSKHVENLVLVLGNHDGGLDRIVSKLNVSNVKIFDSRGLILETTSGKQVLLLHGNSRPRIEDLLKCDVLVMGHTHPTIMFTDRLGYKSFESCWIKTSFLENNLKKRYPSVSVGSQLLIMPAFNPLCGGNPVNVGGIVGPLGNIIDLENSDVYLLDGILIGKIKNLR